MTWQPIETAPKDQTPVLLFHGGDDEGICFHIGRYCLPPKYRNPPRAGWITENGWLAFDEPTHWMPLPDPPAE